MPALLKAYLELVLRPGFAFAYGKGKGLPKKLLAGKSARIVVTMGMPSLFYRLYYRSHSVRSLARNILGFVGFKPVKVSLIGNVEGNAKTRARRIDALFALARRGGARENRLGRGVRAGGEADASCGRDRSLS